MVTPEIKEKYFNSLIFSIYKDKLKKIDENNRLAELGGGEARIKKHHDSNKKTARERIEYLLDPGTFVEMDKFMVSENTKFGVDKNRVLGDGFVTRLFIAAMICYFPLLLSVIGIMSEPVTDIEHFYRVTGRLRWQLEVKIRAFENLHKLTTVISGSATLAMAGTIVAEFIAADAGIGYSIRIALYQSDLSKILVALFIIGITLSLYQGFLELLGAGVKKAWAAG